MEGSIVRFVCDLHGCSYLPLLKIGAVKALARCSVLQPAQTCRNPSRRVENQKQVRTLLDEE